MHIAPENLRPLSAGDRIRLRARMNELAECAAARFRSAIRPIYGATDRGEPDQIGSSILLEIRGDKFLLTAAHVVDANEEMRTTLYVGGAGQFVEISAEFRLTAKPDGDRDKDHYDFAVARLPDTMIEKLGDGYIAERDMALEVEPGHLYTAVGYPNTKNRTIDRKASKVVASAFTYSSTWRFDARMAELLAGQGEGDDHVFLGYSKHSRSEEGLKVSSTEPRGLSGGAIVDAGRPSDPRVFRGEIVPVPRLIGMTIERWKEHRALVGTRMSVILEMIINEFFIA